MAGLIGACIVLAILCMILIVQKIYLAYRIRKLAEQVDGFNSGTTDILDVALQEDKLAQLHNGIADLQQSLIRAKQLNSEECIRTSQLTADISHQLKTPLTTLRLYTELDNATHMEDCLEQIQRMEDLIQALLRLERLCADGYSFQFVQADAKEIILEQWQSLQSIWPDKQLIMDGEAHIRCDEKWLGEAFAMSYVSSNNFGMLDDNMFQETMELRSDRNAHESDRQEDRAEYFRLREKYGFTEEAYQTSIMTIDLSPENIEILKDCLVEGNIDVDAINAGEQVLVLAPEVWGKFYENGASTWFTPDDPFFEEYKADGAKLVAWNNCFTAGQTLPLTQLYTEDNTYSTIIRNDAEVQVCGVLDRIGGLKYNNWNFCVIITTEQGLENMGMRMEGLRRIELYLDKELSLDEEAQLERQINAIARRFEATTVQNRMEQNRERVQANRQSLLVMVSVVVLFFTVAVAMIVSSVTRQLQSEGRTIGLLRAVGADEKTIFDCYSGQMTTAVLSGLGLLLIGGCLFIGGCWIDAILSNLEFWHREVAVLIMIVAVIAAVMAALCCLVCRYILKNRIRNVVNMSIIENIREL